ncbi:MAG: biotin/lipoyl-binding protein, partial [Prevotella sp.]|nr:biotin/lipoyl-binding protein [Prevotella sp.]
MDRVIEKTKTQRLIKYWPYALGGIVLLIIVGWLLFGNHASTLRVDKEELTISKVIHEEFKDYVRTNGQVLPIQIVQISPEEGGIVMEKVVEEGSHVRKGDVIVRLSNSNLDLQILNAEAELAEKQNLLRN